MDAKHVVFDVMGHAVIINKKNTHTHTHTHTHTNIIVTVKRIH